MAAQVVIVKKWQSAKRKALEEARKDGLSEAEASEAGLLPTLSDAAKSGSSLSGYGPPDSINRLEDGAGPEDSQLLAAVHERVQRTRQQKQNYVNLLAFLAFTALYLAVLFMQQQSALSFQVTQAHSVILPKDLLDNPQETLDDISAVYEWLNETVISSLWEDPKCGNGLCESPDEFAGFGRFGCIPDCGEAPTTTITIQMTTSFLDAVAMADASWNLCRTKPSRLCWYESDQTFAELAGTVSVPLQVPDGIWELQLKAPGGGVGGTISTSNSGGGGGSEVSYEELAFWGGCKPYEDSAVALCRKVCAEAVTCLSSACTDLTESGLSKAFVDCTAVCNADSASVLQYENATCAEDLLKGVVTPNASLTGGVIQGGCLLDPEFLARNPPLLAATNASYPNALQVALNSSRVRAPPVPPLDRSLPVDPPYSLLPLRLWERLGPTDAVRFNALSIGLSRAVASIVLDSCLARYGKLSLSTFTPKLISWTCAFIGGPPSQPGCSYIDPVTGQNLTSNQVPALLASLAASHSRLNISQAEQNRWIDIMLAGVRSMAPGTLADDVLQSQTATWLHATDSRIVNLEGNLCNAVTQRLAWKAGAHHNTVLQQGDSATWTWADDEPHALLGLDPPAAALFTGTGGGANLVSRHKTCTPETANRGAYEGGPVPCALAYPGRPEGVFSYTQVFDEPGTYSYADPRQGASMTGVVTVLSVTPENVTRLTAAERFECAPGCPIGRLNNGHCDRSCHVAECGFDGGDCACPEDTVCGCPLGQARGSDGACCEVDVQEQQSFPFVLAKNTSNSNFTTLTETTKARERYIAAHNRILGGLLMHQTRSSNESCEGRFTNLYRQCGTGGANSAPYGADAVFVPTSDLYRPDLNMTAYYPDPSLLSSTGLPYGFFSVPTEGFETGYPVVFDINLDQAGALNRLRYLEDGFYLDTFTREVALQFVTYNGDENLFVESRITLGFEHSGRITVTYDTRAVSVEPYKTQEDWARFVLEILLAFAIVFAIVNEGKDFWGEYKRTKRLWSHYLNAWNWVDALSLAMLLTALIMWLVFVFEYARPFDMEPRYEVYKDFNAAARYFELKNDGFEFNQLARKFFDIHEIIRFRTIYLAINGINIFLIMARILKLLDFQPRMGVLTRTLVAATPELLNFFVLWMIVFLSYSCIAHIIFGRVIPQFSTLALAMTNVFTLILGDTATEELLIELPDPLERFAGQLFFWSFHWFMVLVIMNFLIAIAVDAFVEVNMTSESAPTMPQDLLKYFRSFVQGLRRKKLSDRDLGRQLRAWARASSTGKYVEDEGQEEEAAKLIGSTSQDSGGGYIAKEMRLKVGSVQVDLETLAAVLERAQADQEEKKPSPKLPPRVVARQIMLQYGQAVAVNKRAVKKKKQKTSLKDEVAAIKRLVLRMDRRIGGLEPSGSRKSLEGQRSGGGTKLEGQKSASLASHEEGGGSGSDSDSP